MPLLEENGFLPDFDAVPADIAGRAKILWLNYPNNPTGAVADIDFFEGAVRFAKRHDIAICHDGPYSEVAYDGYMPVSFLQAKGRDGRRHRVPLALEELQHDRLAHRHGRRQPVRSSMP